MMYGRSLAIVPVALALVLSGCEAGPKTSKQLGPRGTGMDQVTDLSNLKKAAYIPPPPYPLGPDTGPRAGATYQNVKVLGDVSTDEFNRLMLSMNDWVAPKAEGCNYCHNPENMASDEKYTKVVARRMVQMTRAINTNWQSHVKQTGVTCYTCHRGNAVPENKWSNQLPGPTGITGNRHGQNAPNKAVGYASLPSNIYEPYLAGDQNVRVEAAGTYRTAASGPSIQRTEQTYGLMMRMSTALGVNCTYCHNTDNFGSWKYSTPQRAQAWYGIRMARNVNNEYISSLAGVFPKNHDRLGPAGDPYKVNCATCHQGVNKPLGGVSMLKDNPALAGSRGGVVAAAPAATGTGTR